MDEKEFENIVQNNQDAIRRLLEREQDILYNYAQFEEQNRSRLSELFDSIKRRIEEWNRQRELIASLIAQYTQQQIEQASAYYGFPYPMTQALAAYQIEREFNAPRGLFGDAFYNRYAAGARFREYYSDALTAQYYANLQEEFLYSPFKYLNYAQLNTGSRYAAIAAIAETAPAILDIASFIPFMFLPIPTTADLLTRFGVRMSPALLKGMNWLSLYSFWGSFFNLPFTQTGFVISMFPLFLISEALTRVFESAGRVLQPFTYSTVAASLIRQLSPVGAVYPGPQAIYNIGRLMQAYQIAAPEAGMLVRELISAGWGMEGLSPLQLERGLQTMFQFYDILVRNFQKFGPELARMMATLMGAGMPMATLQTFLAATTLYGPGALAAAAGGAAMGPQLGLTQAGGAMLMLGASYQTMLMMSSYMLPRYLVEMYGGLPNFVQMLATRSAMFYQTPLGLALLAGMYESGTTNLPAPELLARGLTRLSRPSEFFRMQVLRRLYLSEVASDLPQTYLRNIVELSEFILPNVPPEYRAYVISNMFGLEPEFAYVLSRAGSTGLLMARRMSRVLEDLQYRNYIPIGVYYGLGRTLLGMEAALRYSVVPFFRGVGATALGTLRALAIPFEWLGEELGLALTPLVGSFIGAGGVEQSLEIFKTYAQRYGAAETELERNAVLSDFIRLMTEAVTSRRIVSLDMQLARGATIMRFGEPREVSVLIGPNMPIISEAAVVLYRDTIRKWTRDFLRKGEMSNVIQGILTGKFTATTKIQKLRDLIDQNFGFADEATKSAVLYTVLDELGSDLISQILTDYRVMISPERFSYEAARYVGIMGGPSAPLLRNAVSFVLSTAIHRVTGVHEAVQRAALHYARSPELLEFVNELRRLLTQTYGLEQDRANQFLTSFLMDLFTQQNATLDQVFEMFTARLTSRPEQLERVREVFDRFRSRWQNIIGSYGLISRELVNYSYAGAFNRPQDVVRAAWSFFIQNTEQLQQFLEAQNEQARRTAFEILTQLLDVSGQQGKAIRDTLERLFLPEAETRAAAEDLLGRLRQFEFVMISPELKRILEQRGVAPEEIVRQFRMELGKSFLATLQLLTATPERLGQRPTTIADFGSAVMLGLVSFFWRYKIAVTDPNNKVLYNISLLQSNSIPQ